MAGGGVHGSYTCAVALVVQQCPICCELSKWVSHIMHATRVILLPNIGCMLWGIDRFSLSTHPHLGSAQLTSGLGDSSGDVDLFGLRTLGVAGMALGSIALSRTCRKEIEILHEIL